MEVCIQRIKFLNAVLCVLMASNVKHLTKGKVLDILTNWDNCLINYINENDINILLNVQRCRSILRENIEQVKISFSESRYDVRIWL